MRIEERTEREEQQDSPERPACKRGGARIVNCYWEW